MLYSHVVEVDRDRDKNNGDIYVPASVMVKVQCESFHTTSYNPICPRPFPVPVQTGVNTLSKSPFSYRLKMGCIQPYGPIYTQY